MSSERSASSPAASSRRRLGEMLLDNGMLTAEQLERALAEQTARRQPLGQTLLQLGYVTDEVMRRALGTQLGVPYIDLDNVIVDRSLARSIAPEFALEHLVLPVAQIGPTLTVAMDDPTATAVIDELSRLTGSSIIAVTSSAVAIRRTLKRMYDTAPETGAEAPLTRSSPRAAVDPGVAGDLDHFTRSAQDPQRGRYAYAALVGLRTADFASLQAAMAAGLPYETLDRLVLNVPIGEGRLHEAVGLSPASARTRQREGRLSPEESDRLLRAAYVCGLALQLFKHDPGLTAAWLTSRQPSLGGAVPLALAETSLGTREVEAIIRRLRFVSMVEG